jgi:L-iditol 2-dehydrogenase
MEMANDERPTPGPGEVLLELTAVGVCGSDVHWWRDGQIGTAKLGGRLTLGHEPAGRVIEIGAGVNPALKCKRVAVEPAMSCGRCKFCLRGDVNICPDVKFLGTWPIQGAYREMMTHPAHLVEPLPDSISDAMGALHEPLAIGVHVADLLKPRLGTTVVIQGAGPVGLACLLAMKLHGPSMLIVVEPLAYRRELALSMGADVALSPDDPNIEREIACLTGGYGAQSVIEAVGEPASFDQMVRFAEPGAKIALVGIDPRDRLAFNHSIARRKGLTVILARRSRNTLTRALGLTAKGIWHPEPLLTHEAGLADLAKTLDLVAARQGGVIKAIIDPRK